MWLLSGTHDSFYSHIYVSLEAIYVFFSVDDENNNNYAFLTRCCDLLSYKTFSRSLLFACLVHIHLNSKFIEMPSSDKPRILFHLKHFLLDT